MTAPMGVPSATLESCPCVRGSDYAALRSPWIFATVVVIELARLICAERLDERSHGSHALLRRQRRRSRFTLTPIGSSSARRGASLRSIRAAMDAAKRSMIHGTTCRSWLASQAPCAMALRSRIGYCPPLWSACGENLPVPMTATARWSKFLPPCLRTDCRRSKLPALKP